MIRSRLQPGLYLFGLLRYLMFLFGPEFLHGRPHQYGLIIMFDLLFPMLSEPGMLGLVLLNLLFLLLGLFRLPALFRMFDLLLPVFAEALETDVFSLVLLGRLFLLLSLFRLPPPSETFGRTSELSLRFLSLRIY